MYDKLLLGGILLVLLSCSLVETNKDIAGKNQTTLFGIGDTTPASATNGGHIGGNEGGLEKGNNKNVGGGSSQIDYSEHMLSICPTIKSTRWKQMCEAVFSGNVDKCVLQRQYGEKEVCESMIAAVKKQPTMCDSVNPFITGIDHTGKVVNMTIATDCYKHYAIATLDSRYCEKSKSPVNCQADIRMEKGEITLQQCAGDSICLSKYAKITKDKAACDQMKGGFAGADNKAECLAMITGDESYCESVTSVDWKYRCIGLARWRNAMESGMMFQISECKGNSDCEREVLFSMEKWAARN